jgi:16S rRNA (guanine966-N2)-methyltransferase
VSPPEVRILAGRWKGRRLASGPAARPTSSRARAAIFDILGERIADARVLDLYAGTGAVGFEAVSRGASAGVLVEPDAGPLRKSADRIRATPSEIVVRAESAALAAKSLEKAGERFDIVFADPPYADGLEATVLGAVAGLLSQDGVFVLQLDEGRKPPEIPGLEVRQRRAYGRNVFFFFGMR